MTQPTRADLAAAVATLTAENAQLRGLLAAVHEAAIGAPLAASHDDYRHELYRAHGMLCLIGNQTEPAALARFAPGILARVMRELLAETPLNYKPYDRGDCSRRHPVRDTPCTGSDRHPMPHRDEDGEEWAADPFAQDIDRVNAASRP
jgi:hypothetical protein